VFAEGVDGGLRVRGFAGLPDGSEWLIDEVMLPAGDPAAAGRELAGRMLAAGAADLLRAAEAMAS
jgi:hydroxymethylbilane synthase